MIYYLQKDRESPIKIGVTNNLMRRLAEHGYNDARMVLGVHSGSQAAEKRVHDVFQDERLSRKEEFEPSARLLDHIDGMTWPTLEQFTASVTYEEDRDWTPLVLWGRQIDWIYRVAEAAGVEVKYFFNEAFEAYARAHGIDDPLPSRA